MTGDRIQMFNAALIGVSGFGAIHYNDFVREHAAGRITPVAATVINQQEEAEKCAFLQSIGCRLYTDYRQMLTECAGKIDICFIPTGIALHLPMTVAALEAGANVYVEKPVAPTVDDAEAMRTAARRAGKFVAVGYQSLYQPETRRIKELLLSGRIGRVRTLKSYGLWPRDDAYYQRNNWAGKLGTIEHPVLDSPFTNALAHYLNLLSFYAGNTFEGTCEATAVQAGLFRANPIESCDTAALQVTTAGDGELLFHVTHCSEENFGPLSRIEGDDGFIEYDMEHTVVQLRSGEREEFASATWDEGRVNIYSALEERLRNPEAFICTIDIAMNHTRICNAVFDSASIRTLPEESFRVVRKEGSVRRVIPGIDAAIRRAWNENRLLDGTDFPWAIPSPVFSLKGYTSFLGTLLEDKN